MSEHFPSVKCNWYALQNWFCDVQSFLLPSDSCYDVLNCFSNGKVNPERQFVNSAQTIVNEVSSPFKPQQTVGRIHANSQDPRAFLLSKIRAGDENNSLLRFNEFYILSLMPKT